MPLDTAIRCFKENITLIQNAYGSPPAYDTPQDMKIAWNLNTGLVNLAESLVRVEEALQHQK